MKAKGLDGINIVPHLKADTAPDRDLYWRWIAQAAIREDNWKLLLGGQRQYLFDLDADPGELNNLAAKHPERIAQLKKKLTTWSKDLQPAGLTTDGMSEVWEQYFDFYLDGKPAPPLRKKPEVAPKPQNATTIRNGTSHPLQTIVGQSKNRRKKAESK